MTLDQEAHLGSLAVRSAVELTRDDASDPSLLAQVGERSAIIDFEDVAVGDPAGCAPRQIAMHEYRLEVHLAQEDRLTNAPATPR
jgi:hypothetical protein